MAKVFVLSEVALGVIGTFSSYKKATDIRDIIATNLKVIKKRGKEATFSIQESEINTIYPFMINGVNVLEAYTNVFYNGVNTEGDTVQLGGFLNKESV